MSSDYYFYHIHYFNIAAEKPEDARSLLLNVLTLSECITANKTFEKQITLDVFGRREVRQSELKIKDGSLRTRMLNLSF